MFSRHKKPPTIFHITHQKAGSQWILFAFKTLIPDRFVEPKANHEQFFKTPIVEGGFYPTIYLPRKSFESVPIPENHKKFVVIRDLRDTLVSFYFSMKYSHALLAESIREMRDTLNRLPIDDGLIFLMKRFEGHHAVIQDSWFDSGELILKYEDLITDETPRLLELFDFCEIRASKKQRLEAIAKSSFKSRSSGRLLGEENPKHHLRKGTPGDWKNHFSQPVKQAFKEKFGPLLIKTGYETNLDW